MADAAMNGSGRRLRRVWDVCCCCVKEDDGEGVRKAFVTMELFAVDKRAAEAAAVENFILRFCVLLYCYYDQRLEEVPFLQSLGFGSYWQLRR